MYQASTLSALSLGYTRPVISVEELLAHGDTGLGTFVDVNGEMIVLDGTCYRAKSDGAVVMVHEDELIPFAAVGHLQPERRFELEGIGSIEQLKQELDLIVEEGFGINTMHLGRIDARFSKVSARSESPTRSQHVSLKDILSNTQRDFFFEDIEGSLVFVYYPPYLDGVNAPGWHFHFISADRSCGGHVFDVSFEAGSGMLDKESSLEIQLPKDPGFDTYDLSSASQEEIRQVEQGTGDAAGKGA